jgi:hypothetical protein
MMMKQILQNIFSSVEWLDDFCQTDAPIIRINIFKESPIGGVKILKVEQTGFAHQIKETLNFFSKLTQKENESEAIFTQIS